MKITNISFLKSLAGTAIATTLLLLPIAARAYVISTTSYTPPVLSPAPGEPLTDLSAGLYRYSNTDLTLAAPTPIAITRSYRSQDTNPYLFGQGVNFNYGIYLYSKSEHNSTATYTDAEIILPDGGQVTCNRTSSCTQNGCTDYTDAVFTCNSNPDDQFFGATITYDTSIWPWAWDVKTRHGTTYVFAANGTNWPLVSITDRNGNKTSITVTNGQIAQISASNGRYINLTYGDSSNPHSPHKDYRQFRPVHTVSIQLAPSAHELHRRHRSTNRLCL